MKKSANVERKRDGRKVRKDIVMPDAAKLITSRQYQKLVAKIEGKPEERILSYLMLRSLKQARYSERNTATSPWPRKLHPLHVAHPPVSGPDSAPDPYGVRSTDAALLDEAELQHDRRRSSHIGATCRGSGARTGGVEEGKFMIDRVGEEFHALIISTTRFGFFVELTELFIEGLVPIDTLPGDRYTLQREYAKDYRGADPARVLDRG